MREQYMRGGEGFIICYSVADKHSFLEAEEYRNLILKVRLFHRKLSVATSKGAFTNDVRTEGEGKRGVTPKANIVRKIARILYSKSATIPGAGGCKKSQHL